MRFASLLLLGTLAAGCSVPEVTFTDDGGAGATHDASEDRPAEAGTDAPADTEASAGDGNGGDGNGGDAGSEAGYCVGPDGGTPPPNGLACCPGGMGEACAGSCLPKACMACGNCIWPSVCCTNGANGVCKPYC
ncbi:MAG TPA: hypothetical protein VMI75_22115 [Polyangiaceae bacterium]|nr:hypothetical protein [Polyangiaceae bacterium]